MICPQCKAEFRAGFTHCSDCDVELVDVAPEAMVAPSGEAGNAGDDPFCEFWKGDDPRVRGELCDVLAEADIPYRTLEWQDHLFNRTRFPIFRVAVPFSMFPRAEEAVAAAYGSAEDADTAMNPTEENQPEFRKLLELPLEDKLRGRREEEIASFWEQVAWKRKKSSGADEKDEEQDDDSGGH